MSDSLSDADKIRNKRLAKLGGASSEKAEGPSAETTQSQTPQNAPKPKINISKTDTTTEANPFTQLGLKPSGGSGASPTVGDNKKDNGAQHARKRSQDTIESWEDKTLGSLFKIGLQPQHTQDVHGSTIQFLPALRQEIEQEKLPIRLTTANLEQAILEAASNIKRIQPLDYLLGCWKRITRLLRTLKKDDPNDPKTLVVKEARRLCMSYCVFSVTLPDMFGQEHHATNPLAQRLLVDPENDRGICHDFLSEAVSRFAEDESIKDTLVEAVEQLSKDLAKLSMNDDIKPYVLALRNCVRFPALVNALSESSLFLPKDIAAQNLETDSLLGPFFRLSPMQGEVAKNYFTNAAGRDRGFILNSQNALRMTLQSHQGELFEIVDRFIKTSKESREKTLDWFAATVNMNHKRRAMRVDRKTVSSDGFMVNVTVCLDMLCEPFMDATFSKISRVEADYFRRSPRVDIKDETKINADQSKSDAFYEQAAAGTSNFISEVFFLTAAAHHYGTEAANTKLDRMRREIKEMDKEIARFAEERQKYLNSAAALAHFDRALQKYKDGAELLHCVFNATQGVLLDETSQARSMSFIRYVIVWLMRLVSGVDFPSKPLTLPLPSIQPDVFNCLPEYFIEDVVDHFKFVTMNMPHVINSTQCDELVMFSITCLRSTEYIKNPFLKSGLVSILFYGVMPFRNHSKGILGDVLNALPFALEHLLHALMQFYIDCEMTGAHNQFYDKFNIRYEIFQVIKCIWGNSVYRENLAREASQNTEFFTRYVNLLLNDVTYVLDESFTAFKNISSLTKELTDSSLDETTKAEKQEALDAAKNKAKSYMSLTTETLAMFKLFTDALADSFTIPEVVTRLADMLDYNLDSLVGPKQSTLKVEQPEQYNFHPKMLLSDIVDVYLNLENQAQFHLAIANDGRSYKPEVFAKAGNLLATHGLKSPGELSRWHKLCETVKIVKEEIDEAEQDLGEIPDEFTDPLLATLMVDPVILPVSKTVIDRSTIRQHLLSDPHDPFNRSPLKIEDVIPDTELKAKIDAWVAEKRAAKLADINAMDTAAD